MNESTDELDDLLAPLREAEPTAAMRAANRRAALEPAKSMPWWRRSISVPVPVVMATAAALLFMVSWRSLGPATESPQPAGPLGQPKSAAESTATPDYSDLVYFRTETHRYTPGVGITHRRVIFKPKETE